jgi:hypothetical protein
MGQRDRIKNNDQFRGVDLGSNYSPYTPPEEEILFDKGAVMPESINGINKNGNVKVNESAFPAGNFPGKMDVAPIKNRMQTAMDKQDVKGAYKSEDIKTERKKKLKKLLALKAMGVKDAQIDEEIDDLLTESVLEEDVMMMGMEKKEEENSAFTGGGNLSPAPIISRFDRILRKQ